MKPEEAIDKVLAGLRECQPPIGMESRILHAMRDHADGHGAPSRWHRQRFLVQALALACAAGLILMLGFDLVIPRFLQNPAQVSINLPARISEHGSKPPGMRVPLRADTRLTYTEAKPNFVAEAAIQKAGNRHRAHILTRPVNESASYPAPPLPLTEQERLLLHLARRGNQVDLALLNFKNQTAQLAKDQAAFDKFFNPIPKENEETK